MNRLIALFASAVISFGGGAFIGYRYCEGRHAMADVKAEEVATKTAVTQGQTNTTAAVHEATAQAQIEWRTKTLIQKVPVYVTPEADAKCVVPVGFVLVWNGAIDGVPPTAPGPGQSDDAPSGAALSDVASTAVSDIGTANQNAQQLADLQDWLRKSGLSK